MYNLNNFCNIIASLRKKNNWTQTTLAEKIGIAPQSVSKWECGIGFPDVTLFPVIAEVLGVPIGVLFGEEQTEENIMNKSTEAYGEFAAACKNITVYLGNKCRVEFIEDTGGICRMEAKGDPVFISYLDAEQDGDNLLVQIKNPCGSSIKWEEYDREGYTGENFVRIHTGMKDANVSTINYLDLTARGGDNADGNFEVLCG